MYINKCRKNEWINTVNDKLGKIIDDPFKRKITTNSCNLEPITAEHIILNFQHLVFQRRNFTIKNIKDALRNNNFHAINTIEFLKHIEFYDKI